mgnify:CR=1 FL=1
MPWLLRLIHVTALIVEHHFKLRYKIRALIGLRIQGGLNPNYEQPVPTLEEAHLSAGTLSSARDRAEVGAITPSAGSAA